MLNKEMNFIEKFWEEEVFVIKKFFSERNKTALTLLFSFLESQFCQERNIDVSDFNRSWERRVLLFKITRSYKWSQDHSL